jgi:ribulose-5-phosphate 4-epimerase/fuculose-1-phosphate aldolase
LTLRTYLLGLVLLLTASLSLSQDAKNALASSAQVAELVLANHILANEGVLDAYGHVSVRDDRNKDHFLLARGLPAAYVTAGDIIEYDYESNPINDNRPGFNERFIHGQIYKARPDVNAVVHFHAGEVLPFTVTSVPLRPMIHMAGFLPQIAPIFDIRKAGGMTDMLVRNNELGKALAETLSDKPVALMRGHGAVVVASTLHLVTGRAYYTVVNARNQLQAIAIGGDKVTYLDPAEASKAGDQDGFERGWLYWKNKVQKQ